MVLANYLEEAAKLTKINNKVQYAEKLQKTFIKEEQEKEEVDLQLETNDPTLAMEYIEED